MVDYRVLFLFLPYLESGFAHARFSALDTGGPPRSEPNAFPMSAVSVCEKSGRICRGYILDVRKKPGIRHDGAEK